jgi:hypothetical protein
MLSGNVCGGLELVRRPHNGRSGHGTTIFRALRGSAAVAARCEFSCPQLRFERSERVVSSQTTASTPRVVMGPKDAQQKLFLSRFTSRTRSPHAQASFTCPGIYFLSYERSTAQLISVDHTGGALGIVDTRVTRHDTTRSSQLSITTPTATRTETRPASPNPALDADRHNNPQDATRISAVGLPLLRP